MQLIHDFKISIKDYFNNSIYNDFPILTDCPDCHDLLIKNGFYKRYVIVSNMSYIIFIRRYRCKHCGLTVSILPSFLLPRFQRSLKDIFNIIYQYLKNRRLLIYRRAVFFYLKRFNKNLNALIIYFRETANGHPCFDNKKAIKLLEMIKECKVPTFAKSFHNHFNKCFMAL